MVLGHMRWLHLAFQRIETVSELFDVPVPVSLDRDKYAWHGIPFAWAPLHGLSAKCAQSVGPFAIGARLRCGLVRRIASDLSDSSVLCGACSAIDEPFFSCTRRTHAKPSASCPCPDLQHPSLVDQD